jgi:hypothetical protein
MRWEDRAHPLVLKGFTSFEAGHSNDLDTWSIWALLHDVEMYAGHGLDLERLEVFSHGLLDQCYKIAARWGIKDPQKED